MVYSTKNCGYRRGIENEKAARILSRMKVPEIYFNKYIDLMLEMQHKSSDTLLPQAFIDGQDVGCNGFYIIKLSSNDPKGPFLGYPTGCCQSIGSAGETCAIYGMKEDNSGFYVLCKGKPSQELKRALIVAKEDGVQCDTTDLISAKTIVAESWVWRSFYQKTEKYSQKAVFDNIEVSNNLGTANKPVVFKMYMLLAAELVENSAESKVPIIGVNIGLTTYGFKGLAGKELSNVEVLSNQDKAYTGYTDAKKQSMLYGIKLSLTILLLRDFDAGVELLRSKNYDAEFLQSFCSQLRFFKLAEASVLIDILKTKGETTPFHFSLFDFEGRPDLVPSLFHLKTHIDFLEKNSEGIGLLHFYIDQPQPFINILEEFPKQIKLELIQEKDIVGVSLLDKAINYPDSLSAILANYTEEEQIELIKQTDSYGEWLLHRAVKSPNSLMYLLKPLPNSVQLAAVKEKSKNGDSLLNLAFDSPEALSHLLPIYPTEERLEAIMEKDRAGNTLLHKAAHYSPQSLRVILEHLPNNNHLMCAKAINYLGETVLHSSIDNPESLSLILSLYNDLDLLAALMQKTYVGNSVMHYAADAPSSLEIILKYLPESVRLAVVMEKDDNGYILFKEKDQPNLLKYVIKYLSTSEEILILLQSLSESYCLSALNEIDNDGNNLMYSAVESPDLISYLLQIYADEDRLCIVKQKNTKGQSVLDEVQNNLELLMTIYSSLNAVDRIRIAYNKYDIQNQIFKKLLIFNQDSSKSYNLYDLIFSDVVFERDYNLKQSFTFFLESYCKALKNISQKNIYAATTFSPSSSSISKEYIMIMKIIEKINTNEKLIINDFKDLNQGGVSKLISAWKKCFNVPAIEDVINGESKLERNYSPNFSSSNMLY